MNLFKVIFFTITIIFLITFIFFWTELHNKKASKPNIKSDKNEKLIPAANKNNTVVQIKRIINPTKIRTPNIFHKRFEEIKNLPNIRNYTATSLFQFHLLESKIKNELPKEDIEKINSPNTIKLIVLNEDNYDEEELIRNLENLRISDASIRRIIEFIHEAFEVEYHLSKDENENYRVYKSLAQLDCFSYYISKTFNLEDAKNSCLVKIIDKEFPIIRAKIENNSKSDKNDFWLLDVFKIIKYKCPKIKSEINKFMDEYNCLKILDPFFFNKH